MNNDDLTVMHEVLDKYFIRETLENYLASLDNKDWDGIASCFTDDAVAQYNFEPERLHGGRGVANWLHRMTAYNATNHGLSNVKIRLDGERAEADSLVVATLHQGEEGNGRVAVRGISYNDVLARTDSGWKICSRVHQPTWQYDAVSQPMFLQG